jgi:hypothetical protein
LKVSRNDISPVWILKCTALSSWEDLKEGTRSMYHPVILYLQYIQWSPNQINRLRISLIVLFIWQFKIIERKHHNDSKQYKHECSINLLHKKYSPELLKHVSTETLHSNSKFVSSDLDYITNDLDRWM